MPPYGPRNGVDYGWQDVDDMLDEIEELSDDMTHFVRRMRELDPIQKHNYCMWNSQRLFAFRDRSGVVKDWFHMLGGKCKDTLDSSENIFCRGREPAWFAKFKKEAGCSS
jgi:hypothetical protein